MESLDDVDCIKAMQICTGQRFCVNFDDNVKTLLQAYWDIQRASRDVLRSDAFPKGQFPKSSSLSPEAKLPPNTAGRGKRTIHDVVDGNNIMGDDVTMLDAGRFDGRRAEPFQESPT